MKNTSIDSKRMEKVFDLAITEIEAVLARKKPVTDLTRLAGASLSNYSKIKST